MSFPSPQFDVSLLNVLAPAIAVSIDLILLVGFGNAIHGNLMLSFAVAVFTIHCHWLIMLPLHGRYYNTHKEFDTSVGCSHGYTIPPPSPD